LHDCACIATLLDKKIYNQISNVQSTNIGSEVLGRPNSCCHILVQPSMFSLSIPKYLVAQPLDVLLMYSNGLEWMHRHEALKDCLASRPAKRRHNLRKLAGLKCTSITPFQCAVIVHIHARCKKKEKRNARHQVHLYFHPVCRALNAPQPFFQ